MEFTTDELINITGAKVLINCGKSKKYTISTDTRTIKSGNVYLPLKGANFNGEQFINNAIEKGANGYFTEKGLKHDGVDFALLVDDTKTAYLKLANAYKKSVAPKTIAITGSSGKTTTKEIFYAIFSANRKTHKSELNHNNEIGLCQTLLSMPKDTEVLIVEMGMRGLGEIDLLSKYAEPDIAVITNIGTAHIGRLGSRENIAKAKCEIVNHLNNDGILITHKDEIYKEALKNFAVKHIEIQPNDYKNISMRKNMSEFLYKGFQYKIMSGGEYVVLDAILGIEAGLQYGLTPKEIQAGLLNYKPIEKRFEEEAVNGFKIINDSYNANPDSMKASIKAYLDLYNGEKALVLADMGELGKDETSYHKEIGAFLNQFKNIKEVITVGNLAKYISDNTVHKSINFCNNTDAADYIKTTQKGATLFFKGSRSMKLEEIIEELKK